MGVGGGPFFLKKLKNFVIKLLIFFKKILRKWGGGPFCPKIEKNYKKKIQKTLFKIMHISHINHNNIINHNNNNNHNNNFVVSQIHVQLGWIIILILILKLRYHLIVLIFISLACWLIAKNMMHLIMVLLRKMLHALIDQNYVLFVK